MRRGPKNDVEGFFVSTDFKCLRREPTNDDERSSVSADFKWFRKGCGAGEGAH